MISIIFAIAACNRSSFVPPVSPVPMDTPEVLVVKAVTALHRGDKKAFLECFSSSQVEYQVLESIILASESFIAFKKRFIQVYGKSAWLSFQDREQAPGHADMSMTFVTANDVLNAKEWRPKGYKPKYHFPNTNGPTFITRQGDGWIIKMGNMLGDTSDERKLRYIELMNSIRDLTQKYSQVIGKANILPEDLDFQMGKEVMDILFGIKILAPDRFNIDAIISPNN